VLVEMLVDRGSVKSVADLYKLTEDEIAGLERMGKKSARKLIEQIEASKIRELRRLLYGLDIRHIGERNAAILAKYFRSIDRLAAAT
ncbi:NAD-dependent DNA ligase LigA, partial [Vibrio parahaemolyticus]|uniref:helix-hairpin-helix domain-containing protein n=1 Tax=Vibrio parahaemolyticus TaxID=670 RepID=UPI001AD133BC